MITNDTLHALFISHEQKDAILNNPAKISQKKRVCMHQCRMGDTSSCHHNDTQFKKKDRMHTCTVLFFCFRFFTLANDHALTQDNDYSHLYTYTFHFTIHIFWLYFVHNPPPLFFFNDIIDFTIFSCYGW